MEEVKYSTEYSKYSNLKDFSWRRRWLVGSIGWRRCVRATHLGRTQRRASQGQTGGHGWTRKTRTKTTKAKKTKIQSCERLNYYNDQGRSVAMNASEAGRARVAENWLELWMGRCRRREAFVAFSCVTV